MNKATENEAYNDMARTPLQKIYIAIKTALLQVHTHLLGLCHRGISETRLFCRLNPYRLANFTV